jgi:hypothetical protein
MTIYTEKEFLSIASKTVTFRVRIYSNWGGFLYEKDVKAFGATAFLGSASSVAKAISEEVFKNVEMWNNTKNPDCKQLKLENGNNCLIYEPNTVPTGGRKKGSKDTYQRTRTTKESIEVLEPILENPEDLFDDFEDSDKGAEID